MAKLNLGRWEKQFREAAEADHLAIFKDHLSRLDLPNDPEEMLEGTIYLVAACLTYAGMDNKPALNLLKMQNYDPTRSRSAKYAFTFNIHGRAVGRVLVPDNWDMIDLADLYGFGFVTYEVCGYDRLWISRANWKALTRKEMLKLEDQVMYDLRFDYTQEELDIFIDDSSPAGTLSIALQDCDNFDADDENDDE
jgi:hypothetical protein